MEVAHLSSISVNLIYVKLKNSQLFDIWSIYSLKVMVEPMFSRPCCHHIYGGKRHDDGLTGFEPWDL